MPRWQSQTHYFGEILFITLAAMVCGMKGFDDFDRFAKLKDAWLRHIASCPPFCG